MESDTLSHSRSSRIGNGGFRRFGTSLSCNAAGLSSLGRARTGIIAASSASSLAGTPSPHPNVAPAIFRLKGRGTCNHRARTADEQQNDVDIEACDVHAIV
eukprot:g11812.t1